MCINDGWPCTSARQHLKSSGEMHGGGGRVQGDEVQPGQGMAEGGRPELMFSFGLCQVVQGAKEDEGRRPVQGGGWLRASAVPRAQPARPQLRHELRLGRV